MATTAYRPNRFSASMAMMHSATPSAPIKNSSLVAWKITGRGVITSRATKVLFLMGALGVALCIIAMLAENRLGLYAVVAISLSLSLMFPTIYGVALQGMGQDTKFGAAGLVMAILG